MKDRILVITRQVGTVSVFEPLLEPLNFYGWEYDVLPFDQSKTAWNHLGYNFKKKSISKNRKLDKYNLVLTGTSLDVAGDSFFWNKAEREGVPSIAFVDSWINYFERFTLRKKFDRTPKYIGVIDNLMFQRMLEAGAPKEKLRILGHPRFDKLIELFTQSNSTFPSKKNKTIVIFTGPAGKNVKEEYGYTSYEVVKEILILFSKSKHEVKVVLKPHPTENRSVYDSIISEINADVFTTVSNLVPHKLMNQADAVFGMSTILLVDSSKLGIPTYSFQPGRRKKRDDITDRENIKVITEWEGIKKEINKIVNNDFNNRSPISNKKNNIETFISFINSFKH